MASVAFQQLRGLVETQAALLEGLRRQIAIQEKNSVSKEEYEAIVKKLEKEEEEHSKTKTSLAVVSEQLEFALGEIDVLSKHLEREKQAFDSALSRVNNKVLKQSVQKDKLISKCCASLTLLITHTGEQAGEIKQASEFKIEKQQENYIAEVLGKKNKKDFK
ncbi:hypothetical protein JD844_023653 [Phrynosoma platyrhinos]|uniref:Spermatogenesis-associated protein 24 n=1 Tax=Phrynosoma platyrhinos TaxID=52577 RepID=A0ABQ7SX14_PHRPL|nr:hypothetical protein JD844_023653 [Phrynosoma platyrhinos]